MSNIKDFFSKKSKAISVALAALMMTALSAVTAFADEVTNTFPITSQDLSGVTSNFNSAVEVAVPVAIGIMGVILGIKFVPKLIKSVAH